MKKAAKASPIALLVLVSAAAVYYTWEVIEARRDTPSIVSEILSSDQVKLSLEDLPRGWLEMLLEVEDPNFYAHNGMDLRTPGAGITTITQNLVKRMYFENFKPGVAKLRQTLIAVFALDPLVSKEIQLVLFINIAPMGRQGEERIRGFADASEAYFDKSFGDLTVDEYLALVAMVIGPGTFNVLRAPDMNKQRVVRIKRLLSGDYKPKGLMDLYYDKDS